MAFRLTKRLTYEGICQSCKIRRSAPASPPLRQRPPTLFEVIDYGPQKRRGIRALQDIASRYIILEYTGVLHVTRGTDFPKDREYTFGFHHAEDAQKRQVAWISAAEFVNWTRFLNHSCKASTEARVMIIGARQRLLIFATRGIRAFKEIMLDYGDWYWEADGCPCGELRVGMLGCWRASDLRVHSSVLIFL